MADRSYILEILLQARDETARAFASATGQMEAYNRLIDEQKAKTNAQAVAQRKYSGELEEGVKSQERLNRALGESRLKNADAVRALQAYEAAQRKVNQAESEGNSTGRLAALADAAKAHESLIDALAKEANLNKGLATIQAQRITHEADLQARLQQTGRIEEESARKAQAAYQERIRNEREVQRTVDEINRQTERSRSETQRRLERQDRDEAQRRTARRRQDAQQELAAQRAAAAQERLLASVTGRAEGPARTLARTDVSQTEEIRATRELAAARDQLVQSGFRVEEADHAIHTIRQDALRDYGHENQAARDAAKVQRDYAEALRTVEAAAHKVEAARRSARRGGSGEVSAETANIGSTEVHKDVVQAAEPSGGGGILSTLKSLQQGIGDLDTSTSGFSTNFRNAFGFAAVALLQPLLTIILGIVGAFGALASAAIAAGGALGGLFTTALAQGVPALGVLAASMQRLTQIVGYVSAVHQQVQQRFIAAYQTAQLNAVGINQVAIAQHNYQQALLGVQQAQFGVTQAEHGYSNALFAQQQAVRNVSIAQFALTQTRQQATRQLQDLILQERAARLAAEASSLAVTDAQKALRAAIATGGDVQSAQLQLQQAQVQHVQATVGAQRAIQDASQGSLARQGIGQQVSQAQQAVIQARRAATDANFAVQASANAVQNARIAVSNAEFGAQQARAAIALARQQAAGYNAGIAAQLAFLRSQMTATERALAGNIQKIYDMFSGVKGRMRPLTDAILAPLVGISSRLIEVFNDPKFFGAFLNLAKQMGAAIGQVGRALLSNDSIKQFIGIINSAAANMRPLATIVVSFFRGVGAIAQAAGPFVHQFLLWISDAAKHFADWANSARGQNWLKQFFDVGFKSLEAFLRLGASLLKLVLAVVTTGGGAQQGISLLQSLTSWADRTTASINSHGKAWHTLQQIWGTIRPVMSAIGEILRAIGHAFIVLGTSRQGKDALKNIADIISRDLIPGLTKAFIWIGRVAGAITGFVHAHPAAGQIVKDLIAFGVAGAIAGKALGLVFGPIAGLIGAFTKLLGFAKLLGEFLPKLGPALLAAFSNPIVLAITAVLALITILAIKTGNLRELGKQLASPFQLFARNVAPALKEIGNALQQLLSAFGFHMHGAHDQVKFLIDVLGFLFRTIAMGIIVPLRTFAAIFSTTVRTVAGIIHGVVNIFKGIFEVISGIVTLNGGKIIHGFKDIGKGIFEGLKSALLFIPRLLINLFKDMIDAVLKWLGISSPSRKMHSIGQAMLDGLWNALKGIVALGGKLIEWIASGIGKLISWVVGLGGRILHAVVSGLTHAAGSIVDFFGGIANLIGTGVKKAATAIFNLGKWVVRQIVHGIESVIGDIADALNQGFQAGPFVGKHESGSGTAAQKSLARQLLNSAISKLQIGGPVGSGYGGGDRVPVLAEAGEHMLTKEEVRSAGGHGVIFALRRLLGGGGQGGPRGYAQGGAIQGVPQGVVGTGQSRAEDYQGVHGTLGGDLHNIQNFAKKFRDDWKSMWDRIDKVTASAVSEMEGRFTKLRSNLADTWSNILKNTSQSGSELYSNITRVLSSMDKAVFNAFWYVQHAANASLKAFNAKPVAVDLGGIPKFGEGGRLGKAGERGRDAVLALLGRGEAVLNWGHQKIVEPAMRAFYGFGLDDMFSRVRGEHGAGAEGGYAAGGYIYPFAPGTNFGRIDQGIDGSMPVGAPFGPIGRSRVVGIIPNWFSGQPYVWWELLDGPRKGQFAYVSEQINSIAPPGTILNPDQAVAHFAGSGTGFEYGWATASGSTLAKATSGYSEGQVTPAGQDFVRFIQGLQHGKIIGGAFGGQPTTAPLKLVKDIVVKGAGALRDLTHESFEHVRKAANDYLHTQYNKASAQIQGSGAGFGARSGSVAGPVVTASWFDDPQTASGRVHIPGFAELSNPPSSLNFSALGHLPFGELIDVSYGGKTITVPKVDVGAGGSALAGASLRAIDLTREAAVQLPGFINAGLANVTWKDDHKKAFAKGGPVDKFRGAFNTARLKAGEIPFVGHVGEWILNPGQQSKLAAMMGTTRNRLRDMLGLTGGKAHYASGGVLTPDEIRAIAYAAGFRGAALDTAVQVAEAESGGDPGQRYNPGPQEDSRGLWQINVVPSANPQYASYNLYDPNVNAQVAYKMSGGGSNWGPWTTYTSGKYRSEPAGSGRGTPPSGGTGGGGAKPPPPPVFHTLAQIFGGNVPKRGTDTGTGIGFTPPLITTDTPGDYADSLKLFAQAQNQTTKDLDKSSNALRKATRAHQDANIKEFSDKFNGALDTLLKNLNTVLGDNGVFALNAQALADYATQQQNLVALAQSGVRALGNRLRFGRIPSAVRQAQSDLNATIREIPQLERLQVAEVNALRGVNDAITRLERQRTKQGLDQGQVKKLQQLIGDRIDLQKKLTDVDGQLAQELQDRFDKRSTLLQTETEQLLRGSATLQGRSIGSITQVFRGARGIASIFNNLQGVLAKVGPTLANAIAQMAQSIAQTLGDPQKILVADQALIQAAVATQQDLMHQYQKAAARARTDPRWQKIADDLLNQLTTATETVVQAQAQALQDAVNAQDIRGQQQQQAIDLYNRILAVRASLGDQVGAAQGQIAVSQANATGLGQQIGAYRNLYALAQQSGNVQVMNDLSQKIGDLTAQMSEANLQTRQLITAYRQLSVTILQTQTQASSGFFSAATQIATTLGAIAGNQNLPALIAYAKEAASTLLSQAREVVQTVTAAMSDPNLPFSIFQGAANQLLGPLVAAFQQGPQSFANTLAQMSPQLSTFEAGLPPDQQTLFQNLVQAMIDNTTAQVDNTQQLQQLNATSNQQQFTSSAWTMFREAIFNGLGGLLPRYAMQVPSMDVGGAITQSGLLYGHRGETITPAGVERGRNLGGNNYENKFYIEHPMEVADPVYLANAIAWRLNSDPNSR